MALAISDSRRQTGAGALLDSPGAALEAAGLDDIDGFVAAWRTHVTRLADALGWDAPDVAVRAFPGGVSLAVAAAVDALYVAAELNEAAARLAYADVTGGAADEAAEDVVTRLRHLVSRDRDDALVALLGAAEAHGVSALWDGDAVTLGLGAGGHTWHARTLPEADAVEWDALHDVPVALVTGTNGKSTTVRMLAAMATAAGHVPGVSTTDYVAVGSDVVETGDFSGPMGARAALRDRRTTVGLLEVARGGLLRRGVPLRRAAVACVTNVADDHLGEYGIESVAALARVKFIVAKGLMPGGTLVLSADDGPTCTEADRQAGAIGACRVVWVSHDPEHPRLAGSTLAAAVMDGHVAVRRDGEWTPLVAVTEMPSSLGGAARHNVLNALSAVATGAALGLPDEALEAGLRAFRGDASDNPGRSNLWDVRGATVVVDYAHNAHGLAALIAFAGHLPARRRLILLSAAGDRPDADVARIADAARLFSADRTHVADLPGYLRGRQPGEVPALLTRSLVEAGVEAETIASFADPAEATRAALAWAEPGDVLLLAVLSHRDAVAAMIMEAA